MRDPMNERIVRLEEKVAFLEEAVAFSAQSVQEVNLQLLAIRREMADLRNSASPIDDDRPQGSERPPHY
jgi:uncharacterized coiled-coil protein SlyX